MNKVPDTSRFIYFAPGDIQIARVDRQCIVHFCEALSTQGADVELVALGIRVMDVEPKAEHPLDLYRVHKRFPVRMLPTFLHQESNELHWALMRVFVYMFYAIQLLVRQVQHRLVLYTKNYGPALTFLALRPLFPRRPLVIFEVHVPPSNALQRHVLRQCDGIVTNTNRLAKELRHILPERTSRIIGTHQGVNLEMINEVRMSKMEARKMLGLPQDKTLAVYTGKIYRGYREIEYIVQAANHLSDDIDVVAVGGREDHAEYWRRYVAEKGIQNIRFTGFVPPSVVPYYQCAADILLLYYPGDMELNRYRSPGKLFEYMAAGRPIVAVDLPVLREVLGDPPSATLVPPDSPELLAKAILQVALMNGEIDQMVKHCLRRVEDFTWEARAKKILQFIDGLES